MATQPQKPQYRIVLFYLAFGILWIFYSDELTMKWASEVETYLHIQNVKGWLFICFTSLLLFLLIDRDMKIIHRAHQALLDSYDQTLLGWVEVMDLRHKETKHHTQRVTQMTLRLGRLAGLTGTDLVKLERGAILHDIGKIGVSDAILLKQAPLTVEEWLEMKRHPQIAYELLIKIRHLKPCVEIPYCHHERWDGQGYPRGLKGQEIPLSARIFAIVDVWDALISPRVYKEAWLESKVLDYLREEAGKQFDPQLVRLFLDHYAQIKEGIEVPSSTESFNHH